LKYVSNNNFVDFAGYGLKEVIKEETRQMDANLTVHMIEDDCSKGIDRLVWFIL